MRFENRKITVAEHEHTAIAAGPASGDLVLLLHGWPEFADSWAEELIALADAGYRAVAVDQRGYAVGARPIGVEHYSMDDLVADALAFADAQGARKFHLVAHDWGGMVAWTLASSHPDRLYSLSVLATPHPKALQQAAEIDADQRERLNYVRFFRQDGGVAESTLLANDATKLRATYGGKLPAELVEQNLVRLTEPNALTATLNWYRGATDDHFNSEADRVATPTLYIWGSDDRALGEVAARATGDFVDGPYQFEVLDGASHWLPEEVPEKVIPLLLAHLTAHTAAD